MDIESNCDRNHDGSSSSDHDSTANTTADNYSNNNLNDTYKNPIVGVNTASYVPPPALSRSPGLEEPLLTADYDGGGGDANHHEVENYYSETVGTAAETIPSSSYQSVVDAGPKSLFGCFPMPSQYFALITVSFQIISVLFLILSLHADQQETAGERTLVVNIVLYSWYFIFVCWIVVPLWQNYSIYNMDTGRPLVFGSGFVCCRALAVFCGLLCGNTHRLVPREDGVGTSTRYLPFSLYNYWFMMMHPGRQLNENLPWSTHERFGFSRSFLLVISTNALGTLNAYIFIYTFLKLGDPTSGPLSSIAALISAITALIGYQVTLLSILYGWLLIPYSIGMYIAFFFFDVFDCTNPKRDTCVYSILRSLWKAATAQS